MRWLGITLVLLLSACESGHEKFYVDRSIEIRDRIAPIPEGAAPEISASSGSMEADIAQMFEQGYGLVGHSVFEGRLEDESAIIAQASKVGAARVLVSNKYARTIQSTVPITTTMPVTTYGSGAISAYGTGGSAYGTYSGTSTTYVPKTTYIPVSVDRYSQQAYYFARLKPACLGALAGGIRQEERTAIGTNSGIKVATLREGGPLFLADVIPGDIILSANGVPLHKSTLRELPSHTTMDLEVYRAGDVITKRVTTGECS